jgi:predicted PurR-regulated permease PerM
MKREGFELTKWIPICIIAVILMIIYKTIDNIGQITAAISGFLSIISPLLYGILFAYFLYLPHHAVEKLLKKVKLTFISKHARGFSTVLVFVVLLGLIVFILSVVVPIVTENVLSLVNSIPGYIDDVMNYFESLPADSIWASLNIADIIRNSSGTIISSLVNADGIGQIAQGVMGFAGGIFSMIMGLVISLYILLDRERIGDFFKRLNAAVFKREKRINAVTKYLSQINKVLFTFIASKGLDSLINFAVATTILLIFGVPYALLLGLIAGAFNFIPYLGSIISAFIISAITLITTDLNTGLYVMICLLIFHQLDGNYIEPRIMKSSLKVSPILVIIAVVIGGAYFNIIGMFLAVPVAVIIKQILNEYIASTEHEKAKAAAAADAAPVDPSMDI